MTEQVRSCLGFIKAKTQDGVDCVHESYVSISLGTVKHKVHCHIFQGYYNINNILKIRIFIQSQF